MSLHSIRVRLTAWYALVLALALLAAGAVSYAVARRQIERSADDEIVSTARDLVAGLRDETEEGHGVLRPRSANELLAEFQNADRVVALFRPDGSGFAAQQTPIARTVDAAMLRRRIQAHHLGWTTSDWVRMYLTSARFGAQPFVLVVGQSVAAQRETMRNLRNAMLATAPVALLIAILGGYALARKSLAPVVRMSEKARAISATSLSERIEVANARDELGELATTMNELLARLERSFGDQLRFMADASHELRTPVAILQGELDVTLSRDDRDAADYRESLEVMHRTVRRLTRIVRDLFLLARSDAGDMPLRREPLYVADVVSYTCRAYKTLAAEHDVTLSADCEGDIAVDGDEDLLQRLIGNLAENAIRHSPRGAEVSVRCFVDNDRARIEVRDQGAGVPAHLREQIFERFFRVDTARTATAGSGAGLGLAIARWVAHAHGGELRLESTGPDGSMFVATLPLHASGLSAV
ncbi:MAG TPA: heavy metal sensor histidine kinase [Thermoanaerobaculia bacterium]